MILSPLAAVSVGFLDSQRKVFNESDDAISITLTKNVTTAQDIVINLVVPPGKLGLHSVYFCNVANSSHT